MSFSIEAIGPERLADYASVPNVIEVKSIFVVEEIDRGAGRFELHEQPVPVPYLKDYDTYGHGAPLDWSRRFDVSKWRIWLARDCGYAIGAAAIAHSRCGTDEFKSQNSPAVLWDIRVRPTRQRQHVATALFQEVVAWAKSNGCSTLEIETQNVNVAACRFYATMGCALDRIDRLAYRQCPEIADEVMLIWRLDLRG